MITSARVFPTGKAAPSGQISPVAVHANDGRAFLGVRSRRDGAIEIVYDRIGVRRSIWEIIHGSVGIDGLQEACRRAINADDCMATLHAALCSAGVRIECIEERFGGLG
jgi:hypothetical protein